MNKCHQRAVGQSLLPLDFDIEAKCFFLWDEGDELFFFYFLFSLWKFNVLERIFRGLFPSAVLTDQIHFSLNELGSRVS